MLPVLEEPETKVFNLCKTVNCMAVYGITMSKAGTLPRQKPCNMSDKKYNTHFSSEKMSKRNFCKTFSRTQTLLVKPISPLANWYLFNGKGKVVAD